MFMYSYHIVAVYLILQKVVYRWNFEPVEREAVMAYIALTNSFNSHAIIEIACVNSPDELLAVKKAYQAKYRRSLEEDVAAHTVGDLRKVCCSENISASYCEVARL